MEPQGLLSIIVIIIKIIQNIKCLLPLINCKIVCIFSTQNKVYLAYVRQFLNLLSDHTKDYFINVLSYFLTFLFIDIIFLVE